MSVNNPNLNYWLVFVVALSAIVYLTSLTLGHNNQPLTTNYDRASGTMDSSWGANTDSVSSDD